MSKEEDEHRVKIRKGEYVISGCVARNLAKEKLRKLNGNTP